MVWVLSSECFLTLCALFFRTEALMGAAVQLIGENFLNLWKLGEAQNQKLVADISKYVRYVYCPVIKYEKNES